MGDIRKKSWRRGRDLASAVLLSTALVAWAAPASAQSAQAQRSFDIAAQSLGDALMQFGAQSGLNVSAPAALTRSRSSSAVSGAMSPAEALSRLLAGTGLTFRFTGPNSVQLDAAPAAADGAVQLGPVRVQGAGGDLGGDGIAPSVTSDLAATEKTGSYTTRVMSTATRLQLTPRETPQAVTVITRQRMDDAGMVDLLDVVRSTPGITVTPYGVGRPSIYARGFQVEHIVQDGITTIFQSYIPSPLNNLAVYDRAEIVRGAVGLMQGAGSPSASINLFRKRPTAELQGELRAAAGSWNDFSGQVDIGGPLTADGAISGRAVAYVQDADNFRDFERQKRRAAYVTLDFKPTETTRFNIGYSYLNSWTNMVWGGLPVTLDGEHFGFKRSAWINPDWEYMKQNYHTAYASLEQELGGDWKLLVNAMYVDGKTDALTSWIMPIEVEPGVFEGYGHTYWAASNRVRQKAVDAFVRGSVNLFGRSHEVVVGGTINREKGRQGEFFNSWDSYLSNIADPRDWKPDMATRPLLDKNSPDYGEYSDHRSQDSIYATVRLNPADSLKLILGGRFDWYESGGWETLAASAKLTLYGGAILDIDRNHSVYVSYTDIFKPQSQRDIDRQVIKPVTGQNFEIGVKGEYLDGALNLSAALFQLNQKNRARALDDQSVCPTAPGEFCYEAAGLVRSRGIDLELQGALARGLQVSAGYTYSRVVYRKDADPARIGTRFDTFQPEHQFKLSTSYTLPGNLDRLRVGGELTWQSKIYWDFPLLDGTMHRNQQSGYMLLDLMAEFKATDRLTVQANLNNVLDKTYYQAIANDWYWGSTEMFGEPRNIMVTARYNF